MPAESTNIDLLRMPLPDTNNQFPPSDTSKSEYQVLSPEPPKKQLPNRANKNVLKLTYEPNLTNKAKYRMSNYASHDRLSKSNKIFVNRYIILCIYS